MKYLLHICLFAVQLWTIIIPCRHADDQVKVAIVGITLLDKDNISVEVEVANQSNKIISYNPRVFATIGGERDALPARIIPGVYRAILAIYPPSPQVDQSHNEPIVRHGWNGITGETADQPTVELKPEEKTKSAIKLGISSMIGSNFLSKLPKGILMQVMLQHWNKTASALESIGTTYKLKLSDVSARQIDFSCVNSQDGN